jgi:environmental stress-induced protein Ves
MLERIGPDAQLAGVWRGGATRAIYALPAEALAASGSALAWLGTATIEGEADYSYFPGQVRIHVPIAGGGVRLRFREPDEDVELRSFAQLRFDGGRPVRATPIDGPLLAFNLITRADVGATLTVLADDCELAPAAGALVALYVARGSLCAALAGGEAVSLGVDETLVLRPQGAPIALFGLTPDAVMILVELALPPWPSLTDKKG